MPAKPDLVAETIKRFDTAGLRSQLLKLDTPTLEALGLLLTDRERTIADAVKWLADELGEDAVNQRAVYRFAEHFRRLFGQVRSEHARRIARLSVADATGEHVGTMHQVATAQLVNLVTEKLVETDNLEQLSGTELSAMIATLDGLTRAKLKEQELALKVADGERKAQKLASDLEKLEQQITTMRLDNERRQREIERAGAAAKQQAEEKAKVSGGAISREEVYELIDKVMKGEIE